MDELYWKPAHELAAMIRRRDIKAAELMELTIKRIEQTNPKLNAFCALRADDAMADARALDEKIARREELGSLAGLPLGVKDLEDASGLPTTHGSKAFKDHMPSADSVQVSKNLRLQIELFGGGFDYEVAICNLRALERGRDPLQRGGFVFR